MRSSWRQHLLKYGEQRRWLCAPSRRTASVSSRLHFTSLAKPFSFITPQLWIYRKEPRYEFLLWQCSLGIQARTRHRLRLSTLEGNVCACLCASGKGNSSVLLRTTVPSADQRRSRGFTLYSLNTRAHVAQCGLHTLTGRVSEVSRSGPATSNILCCLPHIAHCTRRLPATHAAPTTHALA